ncbi:MAG: class 1 fructose-bisphosphatase [Betaproteobacteria bacterium]|nr:class 1 fructose-bisphosphatase [Betaproteobacteria bacterium]NBT10880.1 class 1 fructose-bisphosphatase [Betaproteobacteria bacterium]NBU49164.1 class 1 fructose-bisphosphatase [Betaproteobacteria bacterium]NBX95862.1 class 1 fructose-bisphosphatase [Betaproteobacteria bacterium]
MPLAQRSTLTQFLIEERRRYPDASGDFNALILDVALACKAIARSVAFGELADAKGHHLTQRPAAAQGAPAEPDRQAAVPVQGEGHKTLDVISHEMFLYANEWGGHLAGMASQEMAEPFAMAANFPRGKYLLVFDPLDGSSNLDVNVSVGSIFSVLRAPADVAQGVRRLTAEDFLQPGTQQVAAGYAIYGPTTMLMLTVGSGVHGFTLDPSLGEFKLTHPDVMIPSDTQEFAINASNSRFWEPPVKRYVDECLAGKTGPRGKDFNMRWIASSVAEAHRILMRGGVFLYPRDTKDPAKPGSLRLLYEANPIGLLMEQAGGRASTGCGPVLQVQPQSLQQRIGLVFGSRSEVERIERYHDEPLPMKKADFETPLFAERSLFRP